MIKVETVGMIQRTVANPVLVSDKDVVNNTLATIDGNIYLVHNIISGDDSYLQDIVIPAGKLINGYDLRSLANQKLVIDAKHIAEEVAVGDTLTLGEDGMLAKGGEDASGMSFKVTDINVTLTAKGAVKAEIIAA